MRRLLARAVLIAAALAAPALIAGERQPGNAAGAAPPEPARAERATESLRANAVNAERYVTRGLCEREGLRQIARLLAESDVEEMWAFVPRAGRGGCVWHEIGRDERARAHRSTLRVDMGYLAGLIARHGEIHLVHFHPRRYFECALSADCPKRIEPGGPLDRRWLTDLVYAMPSPSDVMFMMNVTSRFREHRPDGTIRHKVVTPYGIVDYGLTAEGLARYDSERNGRSQGRYIPMVMASALDDDSVEKLVRDNPRSIASAVPRLARSLNTRFLRLTHTPD